MASDLLKIFRHALLSRDRLDVVEVNIDQLARFQQFLEPRPNPRKEVMESVPLDITNPKMDDSWRGL